jgi:hypothetical protein
MTRHASDNGVLAICRVTATTGLAGSVFAAKKTNTDALTDLPARDAWADFLDSTNCFVARHARIHYARQLPFNGTRVGMTYTAGFDTDAYLSCTRRNNRSVYEVKSPGLRYFDCPVRFSHLRLLSICTNCLVFLHRNFGSRAFLTTQVCCSKGKERAIPKCLKRLGI